MAIEVCLLRIIDIYAGYIATTIRSDIEPMQSSDDDVDPGPWLCPCPIEGHEILPRPKTRPSIYIV